MDPCRIAVVGAGLIGKRHLERIKPNRHCRCIAICDTDTGCKSIAEEFGAPFYQDYVSMLEKEAPEGVVVATPTVEHEAVGLACAERSVPMLMEKPITATIEEGRRLTDAAKKNGIPILVGHYRRFNPFVQRARAIVQGGEIGRLVSALFVWALLKPDDYFLTKWRTRSGQ